MSTAAPGEPFRTGLIDKPVNTAYFSIREVVGDLTSLKINVESALTGAAVPLDSVIRQCIYRIDLE